MSASWGLGQIMGANHASVGFGDVEDMVKAFVVSEDEQLKGMARFIAGSSLKKAHCRQGLEDVRAAVQRPELRGQSLR